MAKITTDVTYSELVTLIQTNGLNQGLNYLITDFKTIHYLIDGNNADVVLEGGTGDTAVHSGDTEPLLVSAISVSGISTIAYSENYPNDIIHYDWNPDNWLSDIGFSGGDEEVVTGFTGVINYREDTKNNNIFGYDFRNVMNRRWVLNQTDYPIWTGTTTYSFGDNVQVSGDGAYVSIADSNTDNAVSATTYWAKIIDYTTTEYWCLNSDDAQDINDYDDSLTFVSTDGAYDDCVFQNSFFVGRNDDDNSSTGSILPNNIIILHDDGLPTVFNNNVGGYFQCNTIDGSYFMENTIRNWFNSNIINFSFQENVIDSSFNNNTIGGDVQRNSFGYGFNSNVIGNTFTDNIIGKNSNGNIFGYNNNNNLVGNDFQTNMIYTNAQKNVIGNDFKNNVIPDSFQDNMIGNKFVGNDAIGDNFTNNSIGNDFQSVEVGTGFTNNTIANGFKSSLTIDDFHNNTIKDDVVGINFTSMAHAYEDYNCEILKASNNNYKITYLDTNDVFTVENLAGMK